MSSSFGSVRWLERPKLRTTSFGGARAACLCELCVCTRPPHHAESRQRRNPSTRRPRQGEASRASTGCPSNMQGTDESHRCHRGVIEAPQAPKAPKAPKALKAHRATWRVHRRAARANSTPLEAGASLRESGHRLPGGTRRTRQLAAYDPSQSAQKTPRWRRLVRNVLGFSLAPHEHNGNRTSSTYRVPLAWSAVPRHQELSCVEIAALAMGHGIPASLHEDFASGWCTLTLCLRRQVSALVPRTASRERQVALAVNRGSSTPEEEAPSGCGLLDVHPRPEELLIRGAGSPCFCARVW